MQEFLLLIGDHLEQDQLNHYIKKANLYFRKFDIDMTSTTYRRNNFAFVGFVNEKTKEEPFEDRNTGSFLACLGTWFFREEANDPQKNLSVLFNKFLQNTKQVPVEIEGAYNLIFYNAPDRTLNVVTDRIGLAPVYTRRIGSMEVIGSSCLLLASLEHFEVDPVGLQEFLLANKLFGSTTLFEDIKKLEPGSIFEFTEAGRQLKSYWSLPCHNGKNKLSTSEKVELLTAELHKVMRGIGALFKYPAADLTGGWDSRTATIMMPGNIPKFATVTAGQANNDDVIIAKQMAQIFAVPHYYHVPFVASESFSVAMYSEYLKKSLFLTDGNMSAPLYVNTYINQAKNLTYGVDITLNGSGGELYRSYWWDPARLYHSDLKQFKIYVPGVTRSYNKRELVRRVMHQVSDLSIFTPEFDTDIYRHLIELFDKTNQPYLPLSNIEQIANIYITHRMGNWLAGYSKATSRLLNCLSPLLTSKPLEVALQLDLREKAFGTFLRRFHKSINPEIAKITTCYGYPTEPLSFGNVAQFLPAVTKHVTSLSSKLAGKAGIQRKKGSEAEDMPFFQRNILSLRECVKLYPDRMKLIGIFNKQALVDFLQRSQEGNFPYTDFYNNIYTVEAILKILS